MTPYPALAGTHTTVPNATLSALDLTHSEYQGSPLAVTSLRLLEKNGFAVPEGSKNESNATIPRLGRPTPVLLVFVLFWLVLIWGLYDNEIYAKEAAIFAAIWIPLVIVFFLVPSAMIPAIIGIVLLDIVLIAKVFGQDIIIR